MSHEIWEQAFLIGFDHSTEHGKAQLLRDMLQTSTVRKCNFDIMSHLHDKLCDQLTRFLKQFPNYRSPETLEFIQFSKRRSYFRIVGDCTTEIAIFTSVCRDYLRNGDPSLIKVKFTALGLISNILMFDIDEQKQMLENHREKLRECHAELEQEFGDGITWKLCMQMINWGESLMKIDATFADERDELIADVRSHRIMEEHVELAEATFGELVKSMVSAPQEDAQWEDVLQEYVPQENAAEKIARISNAWKIVTNAKDASKSKLVPDFVSDLRCKRHNEIAEIIIQYRTIASSQIMKELINIELIIKNGEKELDKLEKYAKIFMDEYDRLTTACPCRATGYFSDDDITLFLATPFGYEHGEFLDNYLRQLKRGYIPFDPSQVQ